MNPLDDIALGAWTRLRNLIGALDRVDRLETAREFDGWLQQFSPDENALDATIREFLLRALRLVGDPLNFQILAQLNANQGATMTELLAETRLSRVDLTERVNEMARAGLTVQPLEQDKIEATPFALGLLELLAQIHAQIKTHAQNDYLINPKAKMPKPANMPKHALSKVEGMPKMPN
ncbi:MAG: MarR family transcriptional regulator [Chloroflexi bacterium]|nr:MarR family transcriptional regulator [Chloroflexota bacterium]